MTPLCAFLCIMLCFIQHFVMCVGRVKDAILCKSCEWGGAAGSPGSSLWLSASHCCCTQCQFLSGPSHIQCQFSLSVLWIGSSQSSHYRYECRRQWLDHLLCNVSFLNIVCVCVCASFEA